MATQEVTFDDGETGQLTDNSGTCQLISHTVGMVVAPGDVGTPLHTVLDVGQAVPPLLHEAKALGFKITIARHGGDPNALETL